MIFCFDCGFRLVKGLLNNRIGLLFIKILVKLICCFCFFDKFCGCLDKRGVIFKCFVYILMIEVIFFCVIILFFNVKVIFFVIVNFINWLFGFCKIVEIKWDLLYIDKLKVFLWLIVKILLYWFLWVFGIILFK